MSESGVEQLSIANRVIDTEDNNPNGGVMAGSPEQTIADWEIPTDRIYDENRDDEDESKLADCDYNDLDEFPYWNYLSITGRHRYR